MRVCRGGGGGCGGGGGGLIANPWRSRVYFYAHYLHKKLVLVLCQAERSRADKACGVDDSKRARSQPTFSQSPNRERCSRRNKTKQGSLSNRTQHLLNPGQSCGPWIN